MSTTDDQSSTDTLSDDRPYNQIKSTILLRVDNDEGGWIGKDGKHTSVNITDANLFTLAEARKIVDAYPPKAVLMFETTGGGKASLQRRAFTLLHDRGGSMTGSVGQTDRQPQTQSNR